MSVLGKEEILSEIRRTAHENGGRPLGRERFFRETGIKATDWNGKYWIRWSEAISEAGCQPNQMQEAYSEVWLIERLIEIIRELGHFPVDAELRLKARTHPTFPSHSVWLRLGFKQQRAAKIIDYCKQRDGYDDVVLLCEPFRTDSSELPAPSPSSEGLLDAAAISTKDGFVYLALLKIGREKRYKVGKAILAERRRDQISLQLPEDLELVHAIKTDDAYGIEAYWHRRFATKNTKGEWFSLSRQEIEAFKKRKFM